MRSCSFAVIFYNPSDGCKFKSVYLCKEIRSVTADVIVVNILFGAFCRLIHSRRGYHHPVLHFTFIHHLKFNQMSLVNDDLVNDRPPYTGFGFAVYVISCDGIKTSFCVMLFLSLRRLFITETQSRITPWFFLNTDTMISWNMGYNISSYKCGVLHGNPFR